MCSNDLPMPRSTRRRRAWCWHWGNCLEVRGSESCSAWRRCTPPWLGHCKAGCRLRGAFSGPLFALLRVDLMSYWVDGYWGGAVAATGGALVIGALPRIIRRHSLRDSVLLGVGAAILANSRPLEGLVFCLPVAGFLSIRLISRGSTDFRLKVASALLPAILVLACTAAFMGYYNWRVTGNAVLFPRVLYQRLYWGCPVFVWQHP